jgi:hypothetical protein
MCSSNHFVFQILVPRCLFLHNGKWSHIGDIAWIYGNIPAIAKNQVIYANLKLAKQEKMIKDAPPVSSNRKFILIEDEEEVELDQEKLEADEEEEELEAEELEEGYHDYYLAESRI